MEKVNAELELKLERAEATHESLRKDSESSLESNALLKGEVTKLSKDNKNLKDRKKSLENKLKEKDDLVLILESTVTNKTSENDILEAEVENLIRIKFPCTFCEDKFESEEELKNHVITYHNQKCSRCDLAFTDKKKLKEHTCKLHVENPSLGNCYMKNWILAKGCTPIINKATMTEVGILHCEDCWRKFSPCSDLRVPMD